MMGISASCFRKKLVFFRLSSQTFQWVVDLPTLDKLDRNGDLKSMQDTSHFKQLRIIHRYSTVGFKNMNTHTHMCMYVYVYHIYIYIHKKPLLCSEVVIATKTAKQLQEQLGYVPWMLVASLLVISPMNNGDFSSGNICIYIYTYIYIYM